VAGWHAVAETGAILGSMVPEDISQLDHSSTRDALRGLP
jgi:hypothetical protein